MSPRSEESKARRRAYTNQWHRDHPEYKRKWVREHAEHERERIRRWREHNRDLVRAQRLRYYLRHPRSDTSGQQAEPLPPKFVGHPFFDTARFICGNEPYWDSSVWGWEEAMAEAVLALVEGRDPNAAAAAAWAYQRSWNFSTGPLYDNVDVRDDTREVVVTKRHDDWR